MSFFSTNWYYIPKHNLFSLYKLLVCARQSFFQKSWARTHTRLTTHQKCFLLLSPTLEVTVSHWCDISMAWLANGTKRKGRLRNKLTTFDLKNKKSLTIFLYYTFLTFMCWPFELSNESKFCIQWWFMHALRWAAFIRVVIWPVIDPAQLKCGVFLHGQKFYSLDKKDLCLPRSLLLLY